jgi:hypothetical protein
MTNLSRVGAQAAASLRPAPPPAQASVSGRGAAPSAQERVSLEPGKPIDRELSGGQSHSYKVTTISGQYLHIVVEQRGIDVAVVLSTPDGNQIIEADSEQVIERTETVSTITEAPGAYLIEVRSPDKTAKTGRYEIKVEELRAATAEDKYRVAADAISREAKRLEKGTLEAKRKSVEKYHEALDLYRRAGNRNREAITLNSIGQTYWLLGDRQKTLEKLNEGLLIQRDTGDRRGEATTLNDIGVVYGSLGAVQKALEMSNEALTIFRAIGDRSGEAAALATLGHFYRSLEDMQKSLEKSNEALTISRAIRTAHRAPETLVSAQSAIYRSGQDSQQDVARPGGPATRRQTAGRCGAGRAVLSAFRRSARAGR